MKDLTRAKAIFLLRAITAAMGIEQPYCSHCEEAHEDGVVFCEICGEHHKPDSVPYGCQTGDGI